MIQKKLILCMAVLISCRTSVCGQTDNSGKTNNIKAVQKSPTTVKTTWDTDEKMFQGDTDTNGLAAVLWIRNHPFFKDRESSISCRVCLVNTSDDYFTWCWTGDKTNYLKIELLDSEGRPVEKTKEGFKYGSFLTEQELQELFKKRWQHSRIARDYLFISKTLGQHGYQLDSFGLPELFKLKKSGEYTFRVQMRLAQENKGKLQRVIWLPEVTAKIQIRSGDILPENLPPNGQTNSSTK